MKAIIRRGSKARSIIGTHLGYGQYFSPPTGEAHVRVTLAQEKLGEVEFYLSTKELRDMLMFWMSSSEPVVRRMVQHALAEALARTI